MSSVIQFSAILQNVPGTLADVTRELAYWGINIRGISIVDSEDYSILRFVANDPIKTERILKEKNFAFQTTQVIAIRIPDEPGSLSKVSKFLADNNINIIYLYPTVCSRIGAVLIMKTDKTETAISVLESAGIELPGQDDL